MRATDQRGIGWQGGGSRAGREGGARIMRSVLPSPLPTSSAPRPLERPLPPVKPAKICAPPASMAARSRVRRLAPFPFHSAQSGRWGGGQGSRTLHASHTRPWPAAVFVSARVPRTCLLSFPFCLVRLFCPPPLIFCDAASSKKHSTQYAIPPPFGAPTPPPLAMAPFFRHATHPTVCPLHPRPPSVPRCGVCTPSPRPQFKGRPCRGLPAPSARRRDGEDAHPHFTAPHPTPTFDVAFPSPCPKARQGVACMCAKQRKSLRRPPLPLPTTLCAARVPPPLPFS